MEAQSGEATYNEVAIFIVFLAAITIGEALLVAVANIIRMGQSQRVTLHVQKIIHAKSIAVDLEFYENPEYYDRMHRAQQQGASRPTSIVNNLTKVAQSFLTLTAILGLLLVFHWSVALLLICAAVPGVLVKLKFSGKFFSWRRKRTSDERWTSYYNWLLTSDSFAKEMRLFGYGPHFIQRYREMRQKLNKEQIRLTMKQALADFVARTIAVSAVFGSFGYIAYKAVEGEITLGELVMYFAAFQRGMSYLQTFFTGFASLYEDNLFLTNYYEFMDVEERVKDPKKPVTLPVPLSKDIVFNHVNFKYPTGTRKVLEDISLSIKAGEHVAFVGENGSGKTTLVKLLCRLYDPVSGSIKVDDTDITQFNTLEYRSQISVLFQDYVRYHLPARDNIWLGNIELDKDDPLIQAAARRSGADEVITSLPEGYDSILGKWFVGGEELSIGQWQKIALARAFLRKAQIVILDEPTSALDAKAEYEVFSNFHDLTSGLTAVFISHRMSTVRMADRIFVIQDGKITESGTHEELVKIKGKYLELFEMQAQHYR